MRQRQSDGRTKHFYTERATESDGINRKDYLISVDRYNEVMQDSRMKVGTGTYSKKVRSKSVLAVLHVLLVFLSKRISPALHNYNIVMVMSTAVTLR